MSDEPSASTRSAENARLVEESWSSVARGYTDYWCPRFRPFLERAVQVFHPPPLGPLAVPGCGPGEEVLLLIDKFPGRTIVATDPAPEMLALARASLRARGAATALVTRGHAESLSSTVRQAAGVFSSFSLQLLPSPLAALEDWSRALKLGGVISALFWPKPSPGSPHGRLTAAYEGVTGESRENWEPKALEAAPHLGLALELDERVVRETAHASPEEYFDALVASCALQTLLRKKGCAAVDACRKAWLEDHGLVQRGESWVEKAEARLWVLRKTGEVAEEAH